MSKEQQYYDALKMITKYLQPEKLRRCSEKEYGLEYEDALEYAYENVLLTAREAIRGQRRPKP